MSEEPGGVMNNGGEDFAASVKNMFSASVARDLAAEHFYAMLEMRKQLKSHRVFTYRCPNQKRRCMLVNVLNTREGIIVHVPRYKLSPAVNAASSTEDGRAKNTEDGGHKWKTRTFFLESAINLECNCDHIRQRVVTIEQLQADLALAATRPEVILYP